VSEAGGAGAGIERGRLLETARRAARAGAEVIARARREGGFDVRLKAAADFVTEVDLAAERAVLEVVRSAHPDHDVLAEESGGATPGDARSRHRWVIDPLDGTTNFIRDLPAYAVSVSCEEDGRPVASAVLDVVRDQVYSAARGAGAWRDGERLRVSEEERFERSLWLTGIPFRNVEVLPSYLPQLERMAAGSLGIRRIGAASLDLCFLAAGKAEGFWEHGLSRWDVSGGTLIVEEAGGRVTDLEGGEGHLDTGDIVASNGRVHDLVLRRLA